MHDEPIAEAIQCEGCEKFALLVKQKNEQIKQFREILSEIYDAFKNEPYFRSTGRINIAMWIMSINKRIKALEGKDV